jgi:hypothetical protein
MRWWKYVLVLLGVWSASAFLAEFGFRLLGDRPSADLGGMYTQFEDGAYKLAPSVDTDASWSAGHFSVHTDELGLRCDQDRQRALKPGETADIILFGDSQGFGNGLNYEDTLAGALADIAGGQQRKIGNASVGGHGLLNQVALLEWLKREHSVQARQYVALLTPLMVMNGNGFTRASVGDDGRLYSHALTGVGKAILWLKLHTALYSRLRDAARNCGIGVKPDADPFVFQVFSGSYKSQAEENLHSSLQRLKKWTSDRGSKLSIVYIPLTVEVDSEALRRSATERGVALDLDAPLNVCTSVAKRLDLRVHSLRSVLDQVHRDRRPLTLRADFHYNAEVSRAGATSIWMHLEGNHTRASSDVDKAYD